MAVEEHRYVGSAATDIDQGHAQGTLIIIEHRQAGGQGF